MALWTEDSGPQFSHSSLYCLSIILNSCLSQLYIVYFYILCIVYSLNYALYIGVQSHTLICFTSTSPTYPPSVLGIYYLLCLRVWVITGDKWKWVKISTLLLTSTWFGGKLLKFLSLSSSFNKLEVIVFPTSWQSAWEFVSVELHAQKNSCMLDILGIFLETNSSICMGDPF